MGDLDFRNDMIFKDCEFRYLDDNEELCCKNKQGADIGCDNCQENIHLNCDNFNAKKDFCLKFFRDNISELKECEEKTVFNDTDLSRKWSIKYNKNCLILHKLDFIY